MTYWVLLLVKGSLKAQFSEVVFAAATCLQTLKVCLETPPDIDELPLLNNAYKLNLQLHSYTFKRNLSQFWNREN